MLEPISIGFHDQVTGVSQDQLSQSRAMNEECIGLQHRDEDAAQELGGE